MNQETNDRQKKMDTVKEKESLLALGKIFETLGKNSNTLTKKSHRDLIIAFIKQFEEKR